MQLLCNGYLDVVGLEFGPAACSPSGTGCFKACFGALGDDVVFKLRQHRDELEKQHACRCAPNLATDALQIRAVRLTDGR